MKRKGKQVDPPAPQPYHGVPVVYIQGTQGTRAPSPWLGLYNPVQEVAPMPNGQPYDPYPPDIRTFRYGAFLHGAIPLPSHQVHSEVKFVEPNECKLPEIVMDQGGSSSSSYGASAIVMDGGPKGKDSANKSFSNSGKPPVLRYHKREDLEGDAGIPSRSKTEEETVTLDAIDSFGSMENYESLVKATLDSGRSLGTRFFFKEKKDSFGDTTHQGTTTNYAGPIRLSGMDPQRFDLNGGTVGSNQLYNMILCFLIDEDAKGIQFIEIRGQYLDLEPFVKEGKKVFLRVLLRTQVNGQQFYVHIYHKSIKNLGSVQLCFVQFSQNVFAKGSFDCIQPAQPSPSRSFNVWHSDNEDKPAMQSPAIIRQFEISSAGSLAVTLSSTENKLHIDVWELKPGVAPRKDVYPSPPSTSKAHLVLDGWTKDDYGLSLTVSRNGSQIIVYGDEFSSKPAFCSYFYSAYLGGGIYPSKLRHHSSLNHFRGYVTFANATSDWINPSERLLTCDGMSLNVYNASDVLVFQYNISISLHQDFDLARCLVTSAIGGHLIWKQSPYQVSVWSIDSGECQQCITTSHAIESCFLSLNGDQLAIVSKDILFIYSTSTGGLLQRSNISHLDCDGFLEGTTSIYGIHNHKSGPLLSILDSGNLLHRRGTHLPSNDGLIIRDVKPYYWENIGNEMTVVATKHGSILDISYLEDIARSTDGSGEQPCVSKCRFEMKEVSQIEDSIEEVICGTTYKAKVTGRYPRTLVIDITFADSQSRQLRLNAESSYFVRQQSVLVTVSRYGSGVYCSIWKLPRSNGDRFELLLHWMLRSATGAYSIQSCPHGRNFNLVLATQSIHLSTEEVFSNANSRYLLETIPSVGPFNDYSPEVADGILRYLHSHINKYPGQDDQSISVMAKICSSWSSTDQNKFKQVLLRLLQTHPSVHWVPLKAYSKGSNPIEILLEKAITDPVVLDMVRILIDYCMKKARSEKDITYLLCLCPCLEDITVRYAEIALRATRAFAYIPCHDREFIMDNHKIVHPPTLGRLWTSDNSKIYDCRNPILQCCYSEEKTRDPLNSHFTEDIYVVSVSFLWSFIPHSPALDREFPKVNSKKPISLLGVLFHMLLFNLNPFSHVYIQPRSYSLEILDNPAIEAIIQYKWNKYVFRLWMLRFSLQCVYYALVLVAAMLQVYGAPDSLLWVFVVIAALSCIFLWLEFLQWLEGQSRAPLTTMNEGSISTYYTDTGKLENVNKAPMNTSSQRSRYLRSPFNILDLLVYLYLLGTSVHQIVNIVLAESSGVTADYSFSVILVLLHLLAELRVSETVCKYITIVLGILREIKVFFMVFAGVVLFFSIAILHVLYGVGSHAWEEPNVNLPKNFLGAVTTAYLIMGGRYDPLANDIFENDNENTKASYKNGPLLLMLMVYFTFSSILMLNVLIALINVAFVKADDSWRQVWLENRLRHVESAENMSYHIPGFREKLTWFPEMVYYTATPYQVKQYWRRIAKKDEETIFDDDYISVSTEPADATPKEAYPSTETTVATENPLQNKSQQSVMEQLSRQELQISTLKEDMSFIRKQFEHRDGDRDSSDEKPLEGVQKSHEGVSGMNVDIKNLQAEMLDIKRDIHAILTALSQLQGQNSSA